MIITNSTFSDFILYSVVQIEMQDSAGNATGYASGFVMIFNAGQGSDRELSSIVTNRHVLSGCDQISVVFTRANSNGDPDTGNLITATIPTEGAFYHPDPDIDLAAVLLDQTFAQLRAQGVHPYCCGFSPSIIPSPEKWASFNSIETVTMAGYPVGLRDKINNLPIIRRGITATPLQFDFEGKKVFLVDMPCFKGCSGSPVFLLEEGLVSDARNGTASSGSRCLLLGVQFAIPDVHETGFLELSAYPPSLSLKPVVPLNLSLGFVIKSTELYALGDLIRRASSV